jgi:23S rRNA pseudouridine2604 synthase
VIVDKPLRDSDVEALRNGVVITTESQRDGRSKTLTARTMPCRVRQLSKYEIEITLVEGRNRQIRRMLDALGYSVLELHRIEVMGVGLSGIKEGQWKELNRGEMEKVNRALSLAANANGEGGKLYDSSNEEEEDDDVYDDDGGSYGEDY